MPLIAIRIIEPAFTGSDLRIESKPLTLTGARQFREGGEKSGDTRPPVRLWQGGTSRRQLPLPYPQAPSMAIAIPIFAVLPVVIFDPLRVVILEHG